MEASRVQNGIQLLLATEQEAQQIVNTARNTKMARLKRAKEKTEKEVALRFQVEADFERKVAGASDRFIILCLKSSDDSQITEFLFSFSFLKICSCIVEDSSGDYGANVKWLEHETEEKSHYLKTQAA
ncbi:hypothetical protein AB3S75_034416 [Citrus x aurantiifolia]